MSDIIHELDITLSSDKENITPRCRRLISMMLGEIKTILKTGKISEKPETVLEFAIQKELLHIDPTLDPEGRKEKIKAIIMNVIAAHFGILKKPRIHLQNIQGLMARPRPI